MSIKIKLTEDIIHNTIQQVLTEMFSSKQRPIDYKPIGKEKFKLENGVEVESEITLQASSGQKCHIVNDDHCYVLYNQSKFDNYATGPITHIFSEAFEALKKTS